MPSLIVWSTLQQVPPIETNRILSYFNQFVSNTVQILNKFAAMSDTKLMDLDFRLQDVEATLSILEAKVIVAFLGNKALKIHITY